MKKSKKIILIVVMVLIVAAIIGCGVFFHIKSVKEYDSQINELKGQIEEIKNESSSEIDNVISENTVNNVSQKEENSDNTVEKSNENTTNSNSRDKAVNAIKEALKDDGWVNDNIKFSDDEIMTDNKDVAQDLRFIVCKSENPIVMVEVSSEEGLVRKLMLVTYKNGGVTAEKISGGHYSHVGYNVDPNNTVVRDEYMHMGISEILYDDYSTGEKVYIDCYKQTDENETKSNYVRILKDDSEVTITEEEFRNKIDEYDAKYNFVDISTALTDSNVDTYVK